MSNIGKQFSKTVQERQLKQLRPRHYEILLRYMKGQRQRQIARQMKVGEQWVSAVINSPLFQAELQKRLREEEDAVVKRMGERELKRLDAIARVMRGDSQDFGVLAAPSILDRFPTEEQRRKRNVDGIGDTIIKALSRMDEPERKTPAQSAEPNLTPFQAPIATAVEADDRPKGMMADQHLTAQPIEPGSPCPSFAQGSPLSSC